ncbi:MAG TPA: preprotein translocase subunit YajC [Vicinamibacterales bacterium]|jgi:preprotein translocase subunit YajC|nr:preprotein translocase subunit YajC [Vicinamibacterales bacterium]
MELVRLSAVARVRHASSGETGHYCMNVGLYNLMLAMGTPPGPGVNPYIQLIPIALVFAIFYFIILLPTKKKQKKLQEFLDALKVGDRVVTNGGIYGSVAKVNGNTVQLQIADKVRIELAKNAIVGYQGQESLADSTN